MNIGVTFYPPPRLNMKGKYQQCISRRLPLAGQPIYPTATNPWGFRGGRSPMLVSWALTSPQEGHMSGTMSHSVTVCFARRQEYLSANMHHIIPRIALEFAPKFPSRMEWEDLLEVGLMLCNSIRSLKTNVRRKWKPSISKTRCYIALPRNPARAVKSRRSRISGNKLLRRITSLPVRIGIPIPHYPAIVAEINTGGLLGVRR